MILWLIFNPIFMIQEETMKKLTRLFWAVAALYLLISPLACNKRETAQTDPNWERVLSFDDNHLIESIQSLTVFKDQLYAGVADWYAGGTVWRTKDGNKWTRVSEPGFAPKLQSLFAVFQDMLYAGTSCPSWHNLSENGMIPAALHDYPVWRWKSEMVEPSGGIRNECVPSSLNFRHAIPYL
jgi:hypothetical protein